MGVGCVKIDQKQSHHTVVCHSLDMVCRTPPPPPPPPPPQLINSIAMAVSDATLSVLNVFQLALLLVVFLALRLV